MNIEEKIKKIMGLTLVFVGNDGDDFVCQLNEATNEKELERIIKKALSLLFPNMK